jgi:hypothetical protein
MLWKRAGFIAVNRAPVATTGIRPINRRASVKEKCKLLYITDGYRKFRKIAPILSVAVRISEVGFRPNLLGKPLAIGVCAAEAARPVMPGFDNH